MYQDLFPEIKFCHYYVCDNQFPRSVEDHNIYFVTGSHLSVYDDIDWIINLKSFVKEIHNTNKKYIGICFGHQMLAEALGGKVEKAKIGWSIGVQTFNITKQEEWMDPFKEEISLLMMCQDQVLKLPLNNVVIASSDFCRVGMFAIDNRMLGIQAHPDFSKKYELALINNRKSIIDDYVINKALESLAMPTDEKTVAKWILNFLRL